MSECVIYDFETLSANPFDGVVLSVAGIRYDEERFLTNAYTFNELLGMCKSIKFDVADQVKRGRKIEKKTLDWWKKQPKEVKHQLKPNENDVSITELYDFLINELGTVSSKKVFTRGNTFDPVFVKSIFDSLNIEDPTPWWNIRDVRTYIDAFTYGTKIRHNFVPEELSEQFMAHDPAHDVAMDIYRMQYLIRAIYG